MSIRILIIIFSLQFLVLNCQHRKSSNISSVGGKSLPKNNPIRGMAVSLVKFENQSTRSKPHIFCSGTLVSILENKGIQKSQVLTAAHCVKNLEENVEIMISFEDKPLENLESLIRVSAMKPFKVKSRQFSFQAIYGLSYDIALLELIGELPAFATPAILSVIGSEIIEENFIRSVGSGMTDFLNPVPGEERLFVDLKPNGFVNNIFSRGLIPTGSSLSHSIGRGDSGGGVYIKKGEDWFLIAINTYLSPQEKTNILTSIGQYKNWLNKHAQVKFRTTKQIKAIWEKDNLQPPTKLSDFCKRELDDIYERLIINFAVNTFHRNIGYGESLFSEIDYGVFVQNSCEDLLGMIYKASDYRIRSMLIKMEKELTLKALVNLTTMFEKKQLKLYLESAEINDDDLTILQGLKNTAFLSLKNNNITNPSKLSELLISELDLSSNFIRRNSFLSLLENPKKLTIALNPLKEFKVSCHENVIECNLGPSLEEAEKNCIDGYGCSIHGFLQSMYGDKKMGLRILEKELKDSKEECLSDPNSWKCIYQEQIEGLISRAIRY